MNTEHSSKIATAKQLEAVCNFLAQDDIHKFVQVTTLRAGAFNELVSGDAKYQDAVANVEVFAQKLRQHLREDRAEPILVLHHIKIHATDSFYFWGCTS